MFLLDVCSILPPAVCSGWDGDFGCRVMNNIYGVVGREESDQDDELAHLLWLNLDVCASSGLRT